MAETLLSPTQIKLFGRLLTGVTLSYPPGARPPSLAPEGLGCNRFLKQQLECKDAKLARIYAISYEGSFCNLPKPAIFLVHGDGEKVQGAGTFAPAKDERPLVDESGLIGRDFAWESDQAEIRVWMYDKEDVSLRLDVVAGRLDEILLDATLSATAKYAITSRVDLAARVDLASRTDAGRTDLASRVDLIARHRLRS